MIFGKGIRSVLSFAFYYLTLMNSNLMHEGNACWSSPGNCLVVEPEEAWLYFSAIIISPSASPLGSATFYHTQIAQS